MVKKKNKSPKCRNCNYKVELKIVHEDCMLCGGGEVYECPECLSNFDIKTREEL